MNEQREGQGEVVSGTLVRQQPVEDELQRLERRATLMPRLIELAIKSTHPAQWMNLGGKPWPTGAACEVMARTCGVKISDVHLEKEWSKDNLGEFYIYRCTGTFSLPTEYDSVVVVGTCTSRDQALGTETGEGRELSDVDEGNIMKAAYTNMEVNGVTRLLGVRNYDWERLAKYGIAKDGLASVEYEAGAKGGGRSKATGADIEIKFGKAKGKKIGELTDDELVDHRSFFEKSLKSDDANEVKYRKNTQKNFDAVVAVQAERANAKAGTAAKPASTAPSFWERLKVLAASRNVKEDRLKTLTKGAMKKDKVLPSEITEADFSAIADALTKETPAAEEAI